MDYKHDGARPTMVRGADGKLRLQSASRPVQSRPAAATPPTVKAAKRSGAWRQLRRLRALAILNSRKLNRTLMTHKPKLRQRRTQVAIAATGLALVAVVTYAILGTSDSPVKADRTTADNSAAPAPDELPKGDPEYKTVTPKGAGVGKLGGWRRISPPDRDPVWAYTDRINQTDISVSQQPLPRNLQGPDADDRLLNMAKSFSANKKLEVKGLTAYLGTSAKGPQSVIASKDGILILLKSTETVSTERWVEYLSSLR